jgi:GT2 family glycosyltransferase
MPTEVEHSPVEGTRSSSRDVVSILITTHNRAHSLDTVLTRLTALFRSELEEGSAEIHVFNDASMDDTDAVCRKCEINIRYTFSPVNVGLIEARRRLMKRAGGRYLVQLDDDSWFLDPDALARLRATFNAHPKCAVIAANIASPALPAGQIDMHDLSFAVNQFIGCGCAVRADWIRQAGGYPPFLSGYGGEEIALSLHVLDSGWTLLFAPDVRVYHSIDSTQRPLVPQRATSLVNDLGIVLALYPLWLVLPVACYKTISWLRFNYRFRTLGAVRLVLPVLPRALRDAIGRRRPVRTATIVQFFRLRASYARAHKRWNAKATSEHIWYQTTAVSASDPCSNARGTT